MGNEFYAPIQHALTNLNQQVNINYAKRRQQELDLNNAAQKRLELEYKMSDPVRKQRIQVAMDNIRPSTLTMPTFTGTQIRQDNAKAKLMEFVATTIPAQDGGIDMTPNGQLINRTTKQPIQVPNWMKKRTQMAAHGYAMHLDNPNTKREDNIRALEQKIKMHGNNADRGIMKGGDLDKWKAQLKKAKEFDPTGEQRLAEIAVRSQNMDRAIANSPDPSIKSWYLQAKSELWDEAKALNPKLKGEGSTRAHDYVAIDMNTNEPWKDGTVRASRVLSAGITPPGRMGQIEGSGYALPKHVEWRYKAGKGGKGAGAGIGKPTSEATVLNTIQTARNNKRRLENKLTEINLFLSKKKSTQMYLDSDDAFMKTFISLGVPEREEAVRRLTEDLEYQTRVIDTMGSQDPRIREKLRTIEGADDPKNIRNLITQ